MSRMLAVSAIALCMLALPSPAAAYIYWVNYTTSIGRANLDGTGVQKSFVTPTSDIDGLTIDSNYLYWPNHNFMTGNAIARVAVGGGSLDEVFIPSAQANLGIAVDSSYVYWGRGSGQVGRASSNGGGGNPYWFNQAGLDGAYGLAVDGGHMYWTGSCGYYCNIGRASIDGSSPEQSFITGTSGFKPQIAIDGAHIYWANYTSNYIGRANLDGSGVNTTFIAAITPYGVAVDGQHIYWSNYSANKIGRANLDGSGVDQSFITGITNPTFLAVDARTPATAPASTGAPQITGTAAVGAMLVCSDGSWSGSPTPTLSRQWLRDGVAILGATGSTYTVSIADAGHSLTCSVTAQNSVGSATATSAAVAIPSAPANTSPPRVTGTPKIGATLSCSDGSWSGTPAPTFSYQWLRDGVVVPGATGSTYTVAATDKGHSIGCTVSAQNTGGTTSATSTSLVVQAAPENTSPPRITGAPKVGNTLRCSSGSWSGGSLTFNRRWLRDGSPIARATATTYVVKPKDRKHTLRCLVTATNGSGQAQATSAAVRVK